MKNDKHDKSFTKSFGLAAPKKRWDFGSHGDDSGLTESADSRSRAVFPRHGDGRRISGDGGEVISKQKH